MEKSINPWADAHLVHALRIGGQRLEKILIDGGKGEMEKLAASINDFLEHASTKYANCYAEFLNSAISSPNLAAALKRVLDEQSYAKLVEAGFRQGLAG